MHTCVGIFTTAADRTRTSTLVDCEQRSVTTNGTCGKTQPQPKAFDVTARLTC